MKNTDTNNQGKALKAGMWYTVSSIAMKAMAIITTPIYTRLLTTGDYGVVQTFTTWYSLLLIFCSLNLTWSVGNAKQDFSGELEQYIGSLELFSVLFTLVLGAIVAIFWPLFSRLFDMSPVLMLLMLLYLVAGVVVGLEQSKFRFRYQYKENIAITVFISVVTVVVSIVLILILPYEKYVGRVIGCVLPMVLLGCLFGVNSLKHRTWKINIRYIKYGVVFSAPLIFHTVALNILAQSDRLIIKKYCMDSDVGIYSLAYQYAILINIFLNAINEAWLPWFQDQYKEKNFQLIKENVKPLIMFGCILAVGCSAVAPEAILILGGKAYASAVWVVPPIVMGLLCQFLYTRYVNVEMQEKKTNIISTGTVFAAILNLVLNIIFVPKYGFVAAGYTTFVGYLVLFIAHYLVTKFYLKKRVYNDLFMISFMVVTIGMVGLMACLYDQIIVRYVLITILAVVYLVVNKEVVLKIISSRLIQH